MLKPAYTMNLPFAFGFILLFLNDHMFKWWYPNFVTGKISDFAGIFILPMFLAHVTGGRKVLSILVTLILFLWWKSPFSETFIEWYNEFAIIPITRLVDYSDYLALSMLPFSFIVMKRKSLETNKGTHSVLVSFVVLPMISLVFMSTSPPKSFYYHFNEGNLNCYGCTLKVEMSKEEIIGYLKKMDLDIQKDTTLRENMNHLSEYWDSPLANENGQWPFYSIGQIILEKDTIKNLQFALEPIGEKGAKIYLNGMVVPQDMTESSFKRKMVLHYRKRLKKYFRNLLKQ